MIKKKWLQLAALFLLLVVLPGGSWLYLRNGLDYRKKGLSELQDLGPMPDFSCINQQDRNIGPDSLAGQVSVVSFLTGEEASDKRTVEKLVQLHEQFDQRDDLKIMSFVAKSVADSLPVYAATWGIADADQWWVMAVPDSSIASLQKEGFGLESGQLALADTARHILHRYEAADNAQMGRLVEHIAWKLPFKKERRVGF